jgi:NAD(P)-dependent dehydrogenase (short-subunit alcohol dehydrogenase family)
MADPVNVLPIRMEHQQPHAFCMWLSRRALSRRVARLVHRIRQHVQSFWYVDWFCSALSFLRSIGAVIKAKLPTMRKRRSGHIRNVASVGGFITMPGVPCYCGSKFTLEGISETIAKESAGFDVHVTAVAPGWFRTDWAGTSFFAFCRHQSRNDRAEGRMKGAQRKREPIDQRGKLRCPSNTKCLPGSPTSR